MTRSASNDDRYWAMPSARAATASQPSLLRVSGIAGIAIATFTAAWFAAHFVAAWGQL